LRQNDESAEPLERRTTIAPDRKVGQLESEDVRAYSESVAGNTDCPGDRSDREVATGHHQIQVVYVGWIVLDANNVIAEAYGRDAKDGGAD